jgi:hypothetical protein
MLKELYLRDPSDKYYTPDILEHSSELENLLGQIRMILFTKQGDVMGSFNFGFNLEDNIFLFNLSATELKGKLMEMISTYCVDVENFNVQVDVQFFNGSVRDICLIDISVDGRKQIGVVVK